MAEAMLERMNLIDDPDLEATRTLVSDTGPGDRTARKQQLLWKTGDSKNVEMWLKHAKAFQRKTVFQTFLLQVDDVNASPKFKSFKHQLSHYDHSHDC